MKGKALLFVGWLMSIGMGLGLIPLAVILFMGEKVPFWKPILLVIPGIVFFYQMACKFDERFSQEREQSGLK